MSEYFTTRFTDTTYKTLPESTKDKWCFECPKNHQYSLARNSFLAHLKKLPEGIPMCSLCEKDNNRCSLQKNIPFQVVKVLI